MIGDRDHLVAGADAERERARGASPPCRRLTARTCSRLEVLGEALLEQRGARARSSASRSGASRRRPRPPPRRSRAAGSRAGCYDGVRIDPEAYGVAPHGEPARAPPRGRRPSRGPPRAVGAAAERAEDVPRAAVDPDPCDAVGTASASSTPSTATSRPAGGTRNDDARAAGARPGRGSAASARSPVGSPSAAETASPLRSTPVAARQSSASWPPPRRAATSITTGPVRAEPELRVRRAVPDPERLHRGARRRDDRPRSSCTVGQTCASATPNAGGSAVSRSVTVSGTKRAVEREGVDGHLGPVDVAPRRARAPLRDSAERRRRARPRARPRRAHERQPALALPVGRLDDARATRSPGRAGRAPRACGTPASANALALARLRRRERRPSRASIGCGERRAAPRRAPRSRPASRPRARSSPSTSRGAREPVDRLLVLRRDDRALVGEARSRAPAGRGRRRSRRGHARRRGLEQAELRRPGA